MKDKPIQTAQGKPVSSGVAPLQDQEEREVLKQLLLFEERERLDLLERLLDDPSEHAQLISRDLSRAIRESGAKGQKLAKALAPTVGEILHDSVRSDPRSIADALYPAMGPSIRRAISEALRGMVQSFNEALSHSFSWHGLKWRLEALRTKKSFAEVVLLNSLIYRVEQVFLIHRETGLVLQHFSAPSVVHQDADMVSGMLTAIQDFVHDSFSTGDEVLDSLQVGELRVLIEQEREVVLALIVRGTPPVALNSNMQGVLQTIQEEMHFQLKNFQGDAAEFESVRPLLMDCVEARYQKKKKSPPYAVLIISGLVLLLAATGLGYRYVEWKNNQALWSGFLSALDEAPGIVVTGHGEDKGRKFIRGLRDPNAQPLETLLADSGLSNKVVDLEFTLYRSMEPAFVLENIKSLLAPPEGVSLALEQGTLLATGQADHGWIVKTRESIMTMSDIQNYDDSGVVDVQQAEFGALRLGVEKTIVQFSMLSDALAPGQESVIETLTREVLRLQELAIELENDFTLSIYGHTDTTGEKSYNLLLSAKRAELMRSMLLDAGLESSRVTSEGLGSSKVIFAGNNEKDYMKSRRVEFIVLTAPSKPTADQ